MCAMTWRTGCPITFATAASSASVNQPRPGFQISISKRAKPHGQSTTVMGRCQRRAELRAYFVPVIIWLNGGFGAGKTTLAEELHRRLPDAVVYDPEQVGVMLWKFMRPNGDFQDLPSWRELADEVLAAVGSRQVH
jgi:hypothetical protein